MKLFRILLPATVIALACASTGRASTATATFTVSLTLTGTCTVGANPLAFSTTTTPIISAQTQTTTLSVTCSDDLPYSVGLDAGTTSGSTTSARLMKGSVTASTVAFNLFSDSAMSVNWGNDSASWVTGTGSGSAQSLTVYGQVPAQSGPPADSYSTTVTATVTY